MRIPATIRTSSATARARDWADMRRRMEDMQGEYAASA
jgi:hypothetical protein